MSDRKPSDQVHACLGHVNAADPLSHERGDHIGCEVQEMMRSTAESWALTIIGEEPEEDE